MKQIFPILLAAAQAEEEAEQLARMAQMSGSVASPEPDPGAPAFVSAEIGTVNGSTVAVIFDIECVSAPNVTIKVNAVTATHDGGTIQGDAHIVYYVIPIPWHGSGDTVTVDDNAVTNNIAWEALLDLQADTLTVGNGNPASPWVDQSGNENDFTGNRVFHTDANGGYVDGNGVDQYMSGPNFGGSPESITVMMMIKDFGWGGLFLNRFWAETDLFPESGYEISNPQAGGNTVAITVMDASTSIGYGVLDQNGATAPCVVTCRKTSNYADGLSIYINGALRTVGQSINQEPVTDFSTPTGWMIGVGGGPGGAEEAGYSPHAGSAYLVFIPSPSASDCAALETRLGARYGLTVP